MEHVVFTLSWLMVLGGCIGVWGGGRSVGVLVCVGQGVVVCNHDDTCTPIYFLWKYSADFTARVVMK